MALKQRIISNTAASLLHKGAKVAEQLLLIPFFIKFWGTGYYGEWLTLTIIPSFLAMSDFGFGTATANTFLLNYAAGDKEAAANVAKTGIRVITFAIILITSISLAIIFILKLAGVFNHSLIPANEAVIAVSLLLVARILNFYQGIFEAYFRAARKAHMSIFFQSLMSFAGLGVGLVVLFAGGKVVLFSIAALSVAMLVNPVYVWIAIRTLNLTEFKNAVFLKNQARNLFSKGFGYFLSPVWQAVYFQGTTFVIRITLGPSAVTLFNTMRTLIRSSAQAFSMVVTSIYPEFQYEIGTGNKIKSKQLFIAMALTNVLIACCGIIVLGIFGPQLYAWWTSNQISVEFNVWLTFIASILFFAIWYSYSFIFEAHNKPYELTVSGVIIASISVLICWLFAQRFGILGGAIGMLVFDVLMCIILVYRSKTLMTFRFSDLNEFLSKIKYKS